jgi:hypothetical protein
MRWRTDAGLGSRRDGRPTCYIYRDRRPPTPRHDNLLPPLSQAYGSVVHAEVALDWALGRAGLDRLPSTPDELASFLRTHLHAIVSTDLGSFIAAALIDELLLLAMPPPAPVVNVAPPISQLRLRRADSIMLVRVEPADEARDLDLAAYTDQVLRVRHPLPACERMRTMRPVLVIVGPTVCRPDVDSLVCAAREVACEVVVMGAFVSRAAFQDTLRRAIARATSRRESMDPQYLRETTPQMRRT